MPDDVPTPSRGVYLYFEFIALGFVLVAVEEFMRGGSWHSWSAALVFAAAFLFLGVMGPRFKAKVSQLVGWIRNSKSLATALAENDDLKRRLSDLEEQANKTKAASPQNPPKTEGATLRFNAVRSSFESLTFRQKVALKVVHTNHGTLRFNSLVNILDGMGFREPKETVEFLINSTNLVEADHSWALSVNPALIEDVDEVLAKAVII